MEQFNELRLLAVELNKLGLVKFADSIIRTIDYISGDKNTPEDYNYIMELQANFNDEIINSIANSISDISSIAEIVVQVSNELEMINDSTGIVDEILANINSDSSSNNDDNDDVRPNIDAVLAKIPTEPTRSCPDGFIDFGFDSGVMWAEQNLCDNLTQFEMSNSFNNVKSEYYCLGEPYKSNVKGTRNYLKVYSPVTAGGNQYDTTTYWFNKNRDSSKFTYDVSSKGESATTAEYVTELAVFNNDNTVKDEYNIVKLAYKSNDYDLPSEEDANELLDFFDVKYKVISGDSTWTNDLVKLQKAEYSISFDRVGQLNGQSIYHLDVDTGVSGGTTTEELFMLNQYVPVANKIGNVKNVILNKDHRLLTNELTVTMGHAIRPVYVGYKNNLYKYNHRIGSDWDNFRTLIHQFNDKVSTWNEAHPDDTIMEINESEYAPI